MAVLAVAAVGGYLLQRGLGGETTVLDANGTLSVTVPHDWDAALADDGWTPPGQQASFAALSLGTTRAWTDPGTDGEGVFLGLLPATSAFPAAPAHPECDSAGEPVETRREGRPSVTVVYGGCPHGVTVERVDRIASNRLLWVQIRSADRATANRVLDSVETHGL